MQKIHTIAPVFDANSRILILGSFPSVKSREVGFFYGHPANRFWRVLAEVFGEDVPTDIHNKKQFLLRNRIALWDVIASCDVVGSSDQSIKGAVANNLEQILSHSDIQAIYTNGQTATKLYLRHIQPKTGRAAISLPSTSPANAAWSLCRLVEAWRVIKAQAE